MYSLETNYNPTQRILAENMKIGDIAKIDFQQEIFANDKYAGEIILRHYSGFVSLTNPTKTWTSPPEFHVILLPAGTEITLHIR